MKAQVDAGQLTAAEQTMLLEQAQARHADVASKLAEAEEAGQAKKVTKLSTTLEALTLRQEKLRAIEPVKHKLKHQSEMKKLRKELALLDASFDPGRPMKMEKIQAQLDELEADAAEYAIDHDLCPSPALSPSMIACAAGHLTKPRRACVRRAGGSMMMIHDWMRSRKVLKEMLIRLPQRRPRQTRDLLQWARRKRSDECQHFSLLPCRGHNDNYHDAWLHKPLLEHICLLHFPTMLCTRCLN